MGKEGGRWVVVNGQGELDCVSRSRIFDSKSEIEDFEFEIQEKLLVWSESAKERKSGSREGAQD